MAKGKSKQISDPKCRGCAGLLEGGDIVKISGKKWHRECAVKAGKHIPKEYGKKTETEA